MHSLREGTLKSFRTFRPLNTSSLPVNLQLLREECNTENTSEVRHPG